MYRLVNCWVSVSPRVLLWRFLSGTVFLLTFDYSYLVDSTLRWFGFCFSNQMVSGVSAVCLAEADYH